MLRLKLRDGSSVDVDPFNHESVVTIANQEQVETGVWTEVRRSWTDVVGFEIVETATEDAPAEAPEIVWTPLQVGQTLTASTGSAGSVTFYDLHTRPTEPEASAEPQPEATPEPAPEAPAEPQPDPDPAPEPASVEKAAPKPRNRKKTEGS